MLKAIAIDDEPLALRIIKRYADATENLQLEDTCTVASDALEMIENYQPNLIFLDINMPELNGIELFKQLTNPPLVIFTTAYSEYAVEGFNLAAVDYLLKPYSYSRFLQAINKASNLLPQAIGDSKFVFKQDKKLYRLDWKEVLYFNAYGDYVKIVTIENQFITKMKLSDVMLIMPDSFMQVHRSYVVQLDAIRYIEGNQIKIKEELIPVSDTYKKILLERFP